MTTKKNILALLLGFVLCTPAFAQRFSKKEQARQEAREKNYFYGASFVITAGFNHSWMSEDQIAQNSSSDTYGTSTSFKNNRDGFNIGFLWDQSFNKHWGMQNGLFYSLKGGEKRSYYDSGLGYGKMLRSVDDLKIGCIEWQGMARYFIPLSHRSRISINGGLFVSNQISEHSSGINDWNMGVQCGIGYDWDHLAFSVNYQPGIYPKVTDETDSRMSAIMINVGYRLFRK